MIGKLYVRTPNGHKLVASQSGGSIPKGLALCLVPLGPDADAQWTITLIRSGKRIGPGFGLRGDAQRCAEALADCADWSRPEAEILADPALQEKVLDAVWAFVEGLDHAR